MKRRPINKREALPRRKIGGGEPEAHPHPVYDEPTDRWFCDVVITYKDRRYLVAQLDQPKRSERSAMKLGQRWIESRAGRRRINAERDIIDNAPSPEQRKLNREQRTKESLP